jgi:hypothetical protein
LILIGRVDVFCVSKEAFSFRRHVLEKVASSLLFSFDLSAGKSFEALLCPGVGALFHFFSFLAGRENKNVFCLEARNSVLNEHLVIARGL